jgi:ribosome biogenesis protein BRX1
MDELKLTGNSLRGARPLLHFDPAFETAAHWRLIKELFFQVRLAAVSRAERKRDRA